jgi:hypothetical protein
MHSINEHSNKEVVLAAVAKNGLDLRLASEELQANKEVVLAAVRQDSYALQYASEKLKANKEVVLAAVRQDGWALQYASEKLKANPEVVLAAVRQNGWALGFASDSLRANKDFILAAVPENGLALGFASESLKDDASFFWHIWNIQNSKCNDESRKNYINQYLLKETTKTLLGAGLTIASGLLLSCLIALPLPALVILIAATVIGAIYTFKKVAEHSHGFFKAQAESSTNESKNTPTK